MSQDHKLGAGIMSGAPAPLDPLNRALVEVVIQAMHEQSGAWEHDYSTFEIETILLPDMARLMFYGLAVVDAANDPIMGPTLTELARSIPLGPQDP